MKRKQSSIDLITNYTKNVNYNSNEKKSTGSVSAAGQSSEKTTSNSSKLKRKQSSIDSMKDYTKRASKGTPAVSKNAVQTPVEKEDDKDNFFEWLGKQAMTGVESANKGILSTLDFILPTEILGEKYDFVSRANDYYGKRYDAASARAQQSSMDRGRGWQTAGELISGTVEAVPNLALALMTGGGSAAAQGGNLALQTATRTPKLIGTMMNATQTMAKNPIFWSSYAQTVGRDYEESLAEGATELEATASAMISSSLNAIVEIGGGLEVLPSILRSGNKSAIRSWVRSALEEGQEEVVQGVISNLSKKALYDHDKEYFSTTDDNAVINPYRMGKEFGMGAGVGAILGGGVSGMNAGIQYGIDSNVGRQIRENDGVEGLISYGLENNHDTKTYKYASKLHQRQDAGKNIRNSQVGKLFRTAGSDIQDPGAVPVQKQQMSHTTGDTVADRYSNAMKSLGEKGRVTVGSYFKDGGTLEGFDEFYTSYSHYYELGATNLPEAEVRKLNPTSEQMTAYYNGKNDAQSSLAKEKANAQYATVYGKSGGFIQNKTSSAMDRSLQETLNAVGKAVGVKIAMAESIRGGTANGQYADGVVTIAKDSDNPYFVVAKHEITHHMQKVAPAQYRKYRDYAVKVMSSGNESSVTLVEKYKRLAANSGVTLATEQAMDEIAADFTEAIVKDEKKLRDFIANTDEKTSRSFFQAIRDFINKVKKVFRGNRKKMDQAAQEQFGATIEQLEHAEKLWLDALKAAQDKVSESGKNTKTVAESGTVVYSLRNYSQHQIDNWASSKSIVVYENETQLREFIDDAINGRNLGKKMYFGIIPEDLAMKVKSETGVETEGYNCTLRATEVRKIFKKHGNEKTEVPRGQRPITVEDFINIPMVIQSPDNIKLSPEPYEGKPVILFEKDINGKTTVVSYVSRKHLDLTVQTMYAVIKKRDLATAADANAPAITSKTHVGTVSDDNISYGETADKEKTQYSLKNNTFYSKMERVVEGTKQTKLGASSVIPMLKGKGVKDEEIKWTGLKVFLEGKKSVTKEELLEFVQGNQLEIEEEMRGGTVANDFASLWMDVVDPHVDVQDILDSLEADPDGVASYVDDLLAEESITQEDADRFHGYIDQLRDQETLSDNANNKTRWERYRLPGGSNYRELLFKMPGSRYTNEAMQNHWQSNPGVLAHARIQDFNVDGGKMLFVEEIQSDWHNEGQKKGYREELTSGEKERYNYLSAEMAKIDKEIQRLRDKKYELVGRKNEMSDTDYHSELTAIKTRIRELHDTFGDMADEAHEYEDRMQGVPDAPFRSTYHEYVMKRLIHEAAAGGYDSIGWTTGKLQEQRWSSNYAEGYRIEYDQDIPKFMRKYGKQWGATVGKIKIQANNLSFEEQIDLAAVADILEDGDEWFEEQIGSTEVWKMDITDDMYESVMNDGQPMFSLKRATEKQIRDADRMEANGMSVSEIWRDIGVIRDARGKWITEIDDSGMKYHKLGDAAFSRNHPEYAEYQHLMDKMLTDFLTDEEDARLQELDDIWGNEGSRLSERVDSGNAVLEDIIDHELLFEAYPQLRQTRIVFKDLRDEGAAAMYSPSADVIFLSEQLRDDPESNLIHEIQHAIQRIDGRQGGASPEYWQGRIDRGETFRPNDRKIAKAEMERQIAWERMPAELRNKVREINRETIKARETGDFDRVSELIDEIYNSEYADLYSDYDEAVFEISMYSENNEPLSAMNLYYNTAGEIEAHQTQMRRNMTAEERRAKAPNLGWNEAVFTDTRFSLKQEREYQRRGWAVENKILTKKQYARFNKQIGDIRRGEQYNKSSDGLYIVPTGDEQEQGIENVLVYTDARFADPSIEKVVFIDSDDATAIDITTEVIYFAEQTGDIRLINELEKEGNISSYDSRNITSGIRRRRTHDRNPEVDRNRPDKDRGRDPSDAEVNYSLKGQSNLLKENARLKEYNEYLKEQMKVTKFVKKDRKAIDKLAKSILKEYGSNADSTELASQLTDMYDAMGTWHGKNTLEAWEDVKAAAHIVAQSILTKATMTNDELYQSYKGLRDHLRNTKIFLDEGYRSDLQDGYNNFRKANFGRIKLANDGVPVDTAYQELAEMYPEFFDPEEYTHPADQLQHIAEVLDSLQPYEENPYDYDMQNASDWLANEIIHKFAEVPDAKKTYADKQADKIRKIREESKKKIRAAVEKEKAAKWEKVAQVKKQYQDKESRMSERRKKSVYMNKIRKHVDNINKMLINPTDTGHVPESLRRPVAEFLSIIDLSTDRLGEKALNRLNALQKEYQKILDGKTDYMLEVDPDLIDNIEAVIEAVTAGVKDKAGMRIIDMNLNDMEAMYRATLAIESSIYTFNRMLNDAKTQTISEYGENALTDLKTKKPYLEHKNAAKRITADLLNMEMLAPLDYFEELGGTMSELYQDIRDGFDTKINRLQEGKKYIKTLLSGADIKSMSGDKAKAKTFRITNGSITLTPAQVMSLYLLNKQSDAQNHIYGGGIKAAPVVAITEKSRKPKITKSFETLQVLPEDVANITASLTPQQKKIADGISEFFVNNTAEWGNEVSMKLYGYRKFTVENYFPIVSDRNYIAEVFGETNDMTLKNMGSTKSRIKGAKNPLIIEDVFDVYARQVDSMSSYNAFVIPLTDMQRVYNYKTEDGSVKQAVEKKFGVRAHKYFSKIMTDINGGAKYQGGWEFMNTMISRYKQARIGSNLRVILQQPTAMFRAMSMINPKYLAAGLVPKRVNYEKVMTYAPIARWKDWGHFSMDTSKSMKDIIIDKKELSDYTMWATGFADRLTWGRIWNAVESETKAKHPELKVGSEEFYETAGKRFSAIIDRTQVVDSTLHRTQIMRNPDTAVKMSVAFMSEPMKSYNMLRTALRNVRTNPSGTTKKAAFAASISYLTAITVNHIITGLIDTLRGDDDDEFMLDKLFNVFRGKDDEDDENEALTFTERWIKHFADNLVNEPLSMIPGIKDAVSIVQGFTVERMDMAGVADIVQAAQRAMNDKYTIGFKVIDISSKIADVFGIPLSNIKREAETAAKLLLNTKDDPVIDYKVSKLLYLPTANKGKYMDILYDALKKGDTEAYNHIAKDLINSGATDAKKIESAMKSRAKKDTDTTDTSNFNPTLAGVGLRYTNPVEEKEESKFKVEDLSGSQYTEYTEIKGEALEEIIGEFQTNAFSEYDEETQNKLIDAAYTYANSVALQEASDGAYKEETKWIGYAQDSEYDLGISTAEYIELREKYGDSVMRGEKIRTAVDNGIDIDLFLTVDDKFDNTDAKDANGKTVSGLKKERMVNYLNSLGLTSEEWDFFYHEVFGYKR